MPPNLAEIVRTPSWLCFGLDRSGLLLHFLKVQDTQMEDAVFLDQRWLDATTTIAFPLEQVCSELGHAQAAPPRLILHTAFCCSTLLARCMDLPGRVTTLRELPVFSGLAPLKAMLQAAGRDAVWNDAVGAIGKLTSRPFSDSVAVNKPSNVFLSVAADFLQQHEDSRALVIHSGLQDFLISCSKKTSSGAAPWLQMHAALDPELQFANRHGIETSSLSPLQLASMTWHLEMQILQDFKSQPFLSRLRQVSADDFLANPAGTVYEAHRWFGIESSKDAATSVANRELQRHAKQPDVAFDPARRRSEQELAGQHFGEAIERTLDWSAQRFGAWERACRLSIDPLSA